MNNYYYLLDENLLFKIHLNYINIYYIYLWGEALVSNLKNI